MLDIFNIWYGIFSFVFFMFPVWLEVWVGVKNKVLTLCRLNNFDNMWSFLQERALVIDNFFGSDGIF